MSLGSIPDDIRVPLVWIDIDNSQALDGASAQSRKILVMGHAVSSGSTDALSLTRITSDSQADQLYGKGSMLAEMLKMLR
ncbi:TPA: phage tail protein, partial [Escherichia coli]|nr:phage tail protein [Escherichia coli]HBD5380403.1 phage tail protein [Escherichia coli]HBD5435893.1 phage tail protein [Escherichia coli]HDI8428555.1 phage tail protein [Escherichia coli]